MKDSGFDSALPARWGFWQRQKNTLLYLLIRGAFLCVQFIPFALLRPFARGLGHLAYAVAWGERRRALEHLAIAFPERSAEEQRSIARAMFVHLALAAVEVAHMERFVEGSEKVVMNAESRAVIDDALAQGRGLVAVTGHIGNWELLAQVVAAAGYPCHTIAKPLYDPRLTRWVDGARGRYGLRTIWRGLAGGSRDMLRVFRNNGILALLIDQDTKVQGDWVPFFGKLAYTPTAAAGLALRVDAPLCVCYLQRTRHGHRVFIDAVAKPTEGDRQSQIRTLTADLTTRLEAAIRQAPEQWVWMHRRWRRRPEMGSDPDT